MIREILSIRTRWWVAIGLVVVAGAGISAGRLAASGVIRGADAEHAPDTDTSRIATEADRRLWPVHVNLPDGPPRVATGELDPLGRPVTISCASCHANLEPQLGRRSSVEPPMSFHQGLSFDHGSLSCVSCHNPQNHNTLRLADGAAIPYPDYMTMCAQCHAPQARDWEHGAHGGMLGHWDRTRGSRFRKSCIDCHDPHAPQFPRMTPTFKPIDRFLPTGTGAEDGHE